MKLYSPSFEYKEAFLAMALDYRRNGEDRYQFDGIENDQIFEKYVAKLQHHAKGLALEIGRVPQSTFWLMEDQVIYGVSRLRHTLTEALYLEAGHIGYDVPPSHRQKGYGTLLLNLTLMEAAAIGLRRVLVTCDNENIGSEKIILANKGVFENEIECNGKLVRRYWIDMKGIYNEYKSP